MITEKNNVFYCDCGFSFLRGHSGAHDCAVGLRNKLAKSEARCAALAAENGQMLRLLTDISENHDEYVNQDEYLYAGVPMDYVSEINAYVSRDVEAENPFKATDAFLAEVRAQGVEMFAAHKRERQQALRSRSMRMSEEAAGMAADAEDFADQIRKGVQ
ncbi:hypothetical protein ACYTK3_000247 [Enterobacter kobei]